MRQRSRREMPWAWTISQSACGPGPRPRTGRGSRADRRPSRSDLLRGVRTAHPHTPRMRARLPGRRFLLPSLEVPQELHSAAHGTGTPPEAHPPRVRRVILDSGADWTVEVQSVRRTTEWRREGSTSSRRSSRPTAQRAGAWQERRRPGSTTPAARDGLRREDEQVPQREAPSKRRQGRWKRRQASQ